MSTQLMIITASVFLAFIIVAPFWRIITFSEELEKMDNSKDQQFRQQRIQNKNYNFKTNDYYLNEHRRKRI